jgi:ribonuclease HII
MIKASSLAWAVGWCSPREIDKINILQASLTAMARAFKEMKASLPADSSISLVLIDGNQFPPIDDHMYAIVKGDAIVPEIMAASILAKEARDRWMRTASLRLPAWQFDKHKGYPTKLHRQLCVEHGISPIHRRSFRIFS